MAKPGFYAVARGRRVGVYDSWDKCKEQTDKFPNPCYKKFDTFAEAEAFVASGGVASSSITASKSRLKPTSPTSACDAALGAGANAQTSTKPTVPAKRTHSATATTPAVTEGTAEDADAIVVYCDGACRGNGRKGSIAGVGVWWGHGDSRNIAERCPGSQTNNRAELIAIVRILEETPLGSAPLLIRSDSKYSIQCVTEWLPGWRRRDWFTAANKPVANRAIIEYLDALLRLRRLCGQAVRFEHVYGHVGVEGNEGADKLATQGTTMREVAERDWDKEREVVEAAFEKKVRIKEEGKRARVDDDGGCSRGKRANMNASQAPLTTAAGEKTRLCPSPEPSGDDYEFTADDLLDDDALAAELAET